MSATSGRRHQASCPLTQCLLPGIFQPDRHISPQPEKPVAMTGTPQAAASSAGTQNPSP